MVSKWVRVCDFDHEEGEEVWADETITFDTGGQTFEADLCNSHYIQWQAFEAQFAKWQEIGRPRVEEPARPTPRPGRESDTAEHRRENTAIRTWAKTQPDIELGDRGRIPDSVRQRYRDAMGNHARERWDAGHLNGSGDQVPVGTAAE